jgi:hypothetical protein
LSVARGSLIIRFPWSLFSIPLMLLGWYHFSGHDESQPPIKRINTAGLVTGRPEMFVPARRQSADDLESGRVVMASAVDAPASADTATDTDDGSEETGSPGVRDSDMRCRAKVVGNWEDDYQGKRHLTVHEDGTGTMVVDLDGISKKLFAARLTFDLEWSVADGQVVMKTLGGEPKSKVQLVLKLYGNEAVYKILELTDDRFLLLDADGKTRYDWRRTE